MTNKTHNEIINFERMLLISPVNINTATMKKQADNSSTPLLVNLGKNKESTM